MNVVGRIFRTIGAVVMAQVVAGLVKEAIIQGGGSQTLASGWYGFVMGAGAMLVLAWNLHSSSS